MNLKFITGISLICLLLVITKTGILQAQIIKSDSPWIQRDKMIHFTYSACFTPAAIQFLETKNVRHSEIKGAAILFGAGLIKEFVIDKTPRYQDITVNLAGCLAGICLNRLMMKIEKKKYAARKANPSPFTYPQ